MHWLTTSIIPPAMSRYFGFEDLKGGGDKDFNDVIFQASGGIGIVTPKVPEPASVILLIIGLLGVVGAGHRKRDDS
jgi:Domain of unknown function (DUF4114)/PEP-CTERM motif